MGKLSELDMVIKDLRTAATTINDVADTLAEMFSTASADEAQDVAAPAEPVLTLEIKYAY
jgi:ABC-type transporter Mla subunit MlaD